APRLRAILKPFKQARPYPCSGSLATIAPHRCATAAVASVLPLSTTITHAAKFGGISASKQLRDASSFRAGMTRATFSLTIEPTAPPRIQQSITCGPHVSYAVL